MRKLEERYASELVVVGVHSGKYHRERDTARIRDASVRLRVAHPVVNDRQFRVWRSYAVNAWPTIVVVDPRGRVIGQHAGEFTVDAVAPFFDSTIRALDAEGLLVRGEVHFDADTPSVAPDGLCFPGKVALDGDRLVIADSGNDRIVVARLTSDPARAVVERVVGGRRGFSDGKDPSFASPHGLSLAGDRLHVADTENHALRVIDLSTGDTRTIAGTGAQLRTATDLNTGALSSPWDLTTIGGRLFVAMAGSHQIWSVQADGSGLRPHAGSRREEIVDAPLADAALAQPMGITTDGERLYFADAESSAIRWADVDPGGRVGTIVGTGLFDFGDRDGTEDQVLMQHQQGIALAEDGRLLVADSYNDALKWVHPVTREATTWVRGLHEPSGLALGPRHVYVADTNAHRIAVVRREDGIVETLRLDGM